MGPEYNPADEHQPTKEEWEAYELRSSLAAETARADKVEEEVNEAKNYLTARRLDNQRPPLMRCIEDAYAEFRAELSERDAHVERLRGALERIPPRWRLLPEFSDVNAALAATPAQSLDWVKAEALRQALDTWPNIEGGKIHETSLVAWLIHEADRLAGVEAQHVTE